MQRHEPKRPLLLLGLWRSKTDTNKKINERVAQMIDDGLINETQFLLDQGYSPILQSMQGIGYKQTIDYLHNHYDKEQLVYDIKKATHRLAKKQRSRFRRYRADAVGNTFSSIEYEIYELS